MGRKHRHRGNTYSPPDSRSTYNQKYDWCSECGRRVDGTDIHKLTIGEGWYGTDYILCDRCFNEVLNKTETSGSTEEGSNGENQNQTSSSPSIQNNSLGKVRSLVVVKDRTDDKDNPDDKPKHVGEMGYKERIKNSGIIRGDRKHMLEGCERIIDSIFSSTTTTSRQKEQVMALITIILEDVWEVKDRMEILELKNRVWLDM